MPVKEKFLSYVELQRTAYEYRNVYGPNDPRTVKVYEKANEKKREVLEAIEILERE